MSYQLLIPKIQDTLETVSAIKAIHPYPSAHPTVYPAVVYFPDTLENSFSTTADNFKRYRFRIFIFIGVTQTTIAKVFTTTLPKAVDAVIAAFDRDWDGGVIEGHRVWASLNSGTWGLANNEGSLEAVAELNVEIKLSTPTG
jgi:hypothetical protein